MPKNLGSPALPLQTVIFQPVVLFLANKACHIKVQIHCQFLVTLHHLPAPLKHVHAVAENFTHALAGSPPQNVILTDYSLKSDHPLTCPFLPFSALFCPACLLYCS